MRTFLVTLILALTVTMSGQNAFAPAGQVVRNKAASSGGSASFTDTFVRADGTLGANWTKNAQGFGSIDIASNVVKSDNSFDTGLRGAFYNATPVTAGQYFKITLTSANGASAWPGVMLRVADASSPCYSLLIRQDANTLQWGYHATPASTIGSVVQSDLFFSFTYPVVLGGTIEGTGNSTVLRVWLNPTANAPTSVSSWDGSGPTTSFTDNPASAVDSGTMLGIAGYGNADIYWSTIWGGQTP